MTPYNGSDDMYENSRAERAFRYVSGVVGLTLLGLIALWRKAWRD
jgi:hypothetical protein